MDEMYMSIDKERMRVFELGAMVGKRLLDRGLDFSLVGAVALYDCATAACQAQEEGRPWRAHHLAHAYGEWIGKTMWAVWSSMCYALRKAGIAHGPAAFIAELVGEVCQL